MTRQPDRTHRVTIGCFSLFTWLGGGEYAMYYLMKSIDQKRFRPILIVNRQGPLTEKAGKSGIEIIIVPFVVAKPVEMLTLKNITLNIRASLEISRIIQQRQVDVIHCTDIFSIFLLLPALARKRMPVIFNMIVFYSLFRSWLLNFFSFLCIDHIVTNSSAVRNDLLRKTIGMRSKTTVAHCGVDTTQFYRRNADTKASIRKSLGIPTDKKVIGFIGRYEVWKGHRTYLQAVRQLSTEKNDLCFLLIGGPITGTVAPQVTRYYADILQMIRQAQLTDNLFVWDHRDDIPEIMAALDVFVCSSDYEPFGLVVLEAWETGLPVVVTRTVGAVEVVKDTQGVFIAEPCNPVSFIKGIEQALQLHPSEINSKRVYGKCSWENYSRKFEALYEKAAA